MASQDKCVPQMANYNKFITEGNTIKEKIRDATSTYYACLDPTKRGEKMLAAAGPDMERIQLEADTVDTMSQFILKQLKRESGSNASLSILTDLASETADKMRAEIEEVKTSIRTERRRFLDADPSATTAIGGLWFTQQPDNQMIIIFLSCFGSFLLIAGLLVIYGYVPMNLVANADFNMRLMVVGIFWFLTLFITYIGFFTFT